MAKRKSKTWIIREQVACSGEYFYRVQAETAAEALRLWADDEDRESFDQQLQVDRSDPPELDDVMEESNEEG